MAPVRLTGPRRATRSCTAPTSSPSWCAASSCRYSSCSSATSPSSTLWSAATPCQQGATSPTARGRSRGTSQLWVYATNHISVVQGWLQPDCLLLAGCSIDTLHSSLTCLIFIFALCPIESTRHYIVTTIELFSSGAWILRKYQYSLQSTM